MVPVMQTVLSVKTTPDGLGGSDGVPETWTLWPLLSPSEWPVAGPEEQDEGILVVSQPSHQPLWSLGRPCIIGLPVCSVGPVCPCVQAQVHFVDEEASDEGVRNIATLDYF